MATAQPEKKQLPENGAENPFQAPQSGAAEKSAHNPGIAKRILPAILILVLAVAGFVYLKKTKPPPQALKVKEKTWVVEVLEAKTTSLSPVIGLYARTETPRHATLSAAVNADVLQVMVREGQSVGKDALLLTLDQTDALLNKQQREADVLETKAQIQSENNQYRADLEALPHEKALLEFARKAVERARSLKKQNAASQAALDEALQAVERQQLVLNLRRLGITNHQARLARLQAALQRAEALLQQAQVNWQRTQIKAPFAGIVSKLEVAPGERARSGMDLLDLYEQDSLELRAQIPSGHQAELRRLLENGQEIKASAQHGGKHLDLTLERFAGEIARNSGGLDAFFRIGEKGREVLRLGQFIALQLELPAQTGVVAVPHEALYGQNRVYVLQNERMHGVEVENLGQWFDSQKNSYTLIRSAETADGAKIITTHLPTAMEGLKVQAAD